MNTGILCLPAIVFLELDTSPADEDKVPEDEART